jgi:outer membrane protein assembly factor BamD (BamD/ComL family)
LVNENFRPVRIHVRDNAEAWKRVGGELGVQWTPTVLILDSAGVERHRIEGFLPAEDFLAQLTIGLAKSAFGRNEFADAERWFKQVVDSYPDTESAAEALYWTGVSRYKGSNDASALGDTARAFTDRYRDSSWAKKASVWR